MGSNIVAGIIGFVVSTVITFFHLGTPTPKQIMSIAPTPTALSAVTGTLSVPTPTLRIPTSTLSVPSPKPTITLSVTPTIDQQLLDQCNTAFMPVVEFSGNSCLAAQYDMRWIDSMNGHPASQDVLDDTFKSQKEGEVRPMIQKECLKTTKEHFEKCSTSIRDNADRIRNELLSTIQSDVENCIKSSTFTNGTMSSYTGRYMAKDRMKGMISDLYGFCLSHNDSAAEFHP